MQSRGAMRRRFSAMTNGYASLNRCAKITITLGVPENITIRYTFMYLYIILHYFYYAIKMIDSILDRVA